MSEDDVVTLPVATPQRRTQRTFPRPWHIKEGTGYGDPDLVNVIAADGSHVLICEPRRIAEQLVVAGELLARAQQAAMAIYKAFGRPGDYGYYTAQGKALNDLYNVNNAICAHLDAAVRKQP